MARVGLEMGQDSSKTTKDGPKWTHMRQNGTMVASRWLMRFEDSRQWSQSVHKKALGGPKMAQRVSKMAPRRFQDATKTAQEPQE